MDTRDRYLTVVARGDGVERTTFFSDAVFGIALTLLVIEIRVPAVPSGDPTLGLLSLVPDYLVFVLSFVVIGLVWLSHHRKFRMLRGHDQNLLRLNLVLLLLVASFPLPTAILGQHPDSPVAVSLYAAAITLIGLAMASIWAYACRRGLTRPEVTPDIARYMLGQSLVIPAVFALSIPVALLWNANAAEFAWIAAVPLSLLLGWVAGRTGGTVRD